MPSRVWVLSLLMGAYAVRQALLQYASLDSRYVDSLVVLLLAGAFMYRRYKASTESAAFNRHFPVLKNGYLQQNIFQSRFLWILRRLAEILQAPSDSAPTSTLLRSTAHMLL